MRRPRSAGRSSPAAGPRPAASAASSSAPRSHSSSARLNTASSASAARPRCAAAHSMTSRQARSASSGWPVSSSGARAAGEHPGQQTGVAGLPGRGLGPLRLKRSSSANSPSAAACSACTWYAAGQLGVGHHLAGLGQPRVEPEQPEPALPGQAALAPPLVEPAGDAQAGSGAAAGADQRSAARSSSASGSSEYSDRVTGWPSGPCSARSQRADRPGDVPVAGGRFLAGFGQPPGRVRPDRVEHPVGSAAVRARALRLDQRLVDQHGERVQRVVVEQPLHRGQVDRAGEDRQPAQQPGRVGGQRAVGPGRPSACMVACRGPSPGCASCPRPGPAADRSRQSSSACRRLSSSRAGQHPQPGRGQLDAPAAGRRAGRLPGPGRRARRGRPAAATGRRGALGSSATASLRPPLAAGDSDSGGMRQTTSPGSPSGSRLVASTRHARRRRRAAGATTAAVARQAGRRRCRAGSACSRRRA